MFTAAEHRRKGLARAVVAAVLAAHERVGGGHWLLGTGSAGAAKMYQSLGFTHLAGGLDSGACLVSAAAGSVRDAAAELMQIHTVAHRSFKRLARRGTMHRLHRRHQGLQRRR